MDLFDDTPEHLINHLPCDGEVNYHSDFLPNEEASLWFERLSADVSWQQEQVILFGKTRVLERKIALYSDKLANGSTLSYGYSQVTKQALPWSPLMDALKAQVEACAGQRFNACLLNYYAHGEQSMGWHQDNEPDLVQDGLIASVSLGAQRRFSFKHKVLKNRIDLHLEHGSLLLMRGATQQHWLHQLPKAKQVTQPRINLTFRQLRLR